MAKKKASKKKSTRGEDKDPHSAPNRPGIRRLSRWGALLVGLGAISMAYFQYNAETVPVYGYRIVNKFPHDPDAFTQGLVYLNDKLYESTGLRGSSSLRAVDPESGQVLYRYDLPAQFFAEGLAFYKGVLVQLTYTAGTAFVYNSSTFDIIREYRYSGEGWGLAFDGDHFVMSNGSDKLSFRDPVDFHEVRQLAVTISGKPVDKLNELEFIEGEIWANVWQDHRLYRIDPASGEVTSVINLAGLIAEEDYNGREDVLNGIAFDPDQRRLFVTGKRYSHLYEIEVIP